MPEKIKVFTQNCFFGRKVKEVITLIKNNSADIYCLQEVTDTNFAEKIKKETGYNYILSKPIKTSIPRLYFYNAIFTKLPVSDYGELNWTKKRKSWISSFGGKALWLVGKKNRCLFRVYNCYFNVTDHGVIERRDMILDIIQDADKFTYSVIISGDLNTVIPDVNCHRWLVKLWHRFPTPPKNLLGDLSEKNEKYFFLNTVRKYGFDEIADLNKNTWRNIITGKEMFNLKLDWMLYRNCMGLPSDLGDWIGDHRAIIGEFRLN